MVSYVTGREETTLIIPKKFLISDDEFSSCFKLSMCIFMCLLKQLSSQAYDQIPHMKMSSHLTELIYV
jgi:hypothetical protein